MKKLLSLLLVLVLSFTLLASCNKESAQDSDQNSGEGNAPTLESIFKDASEALAKTPYVVTSSIKAESDNEDINQIFSNLNMGDVPVYVDGNNYKTEATMNLMGLVSTSAYTMVGNDIYYSIGFEGDDALTSLMPTTKLKVSLPDDKIDFAIEHFFTSWIFDDESIKGATMEEIDGGYKITLSDAITAEMQEDAQSFRDFIEEDVEVTVSEAKCYFTIKDGKFASMVLDFKYIMDYGTEVYNFNYSVTDTYDYTQSFTIEAPSDASEYIEASLDDLLEQ